MGKPTVLDVAKQLPGHIKVRLYLHTWDPQHLRSHVAKTEYGSLAPYVEEVSILVPLNEAFNRLSAYQDFFNTLQACGVLAINDKLMDFALREEDIVTLAYYDPER